MSLISSKALAVGLILTFVTMVTDTALAAGQSIDSPPGGKVPTSVYRSDQVLPTPAGWTSPTTGTQPLPPNTTSMIWVVVSGQSNLGGITNCSLYGGQYQIPSDPHGDLAAVDKSGKICVDRINQNGAFGSNWTWNSSGCYRSYTNEWYCTNAISRSSPTLQQYYYIAVATNICPPGYQLNGNVCVLATASLVSKPNDNICTLIWQSDGRLVIDNGGGVNGGDPDCDPSWLASVQEYNENAMGCSPCDPQNAIEGN